MVKRVAENGSIYHEPPYTAEEEADFYRRINNGGPITMVPSHRWTFAVPSPAVGSLLQSPKNRRSDGRQNSTGLQRRLATLTLSRRWD